MKIFTLANRLSLKQALMNGYSIQLISTQVDWSYYQLRDEVFNGITKKDHDEKAWGKYDPYLAIENILKKCVDIDSLDYYFEERKRRERKNGKE